MPTNGIYIVNDFTTPYKKISNLNSEVLDALGVSLANKSFSIVLWGVNNSGTEKNQLMITLLFH